MDARLSWSGLRRALTILSDRGANPVLYEIRCGGRGNESGVTGRVRRAPTAAARTLDAHPLTGTQADANLAREFFFGTILPENDCLSGSALGPSGKTVWSTRSAVGEKRNLGIGENF